MQADTAARMENVGGKLSVEISLFLCFVVMMRKKQVGKSLLYRWYPALLCKA